MTGPRRRRPRLPGSRMVRRSVVATSAFNVASTGAAGLAGILIARSLGPGVRGEYAAVMVWFAVMYVVGSLGQPAATTYFVAADPDRAPGYVAVSRNLMVASGAATLVAGMLAAPWLASTSVTAAASYRVMFAACLGAFIGVTYLSALQGSAIAHWNAVRISQPVAYLAVIAVLYAAGWLTLMTALVAFLAATVAQTASAYALCARDRLTGGRSRRDLARPLARYGVGQLAATIPVIVVARLDQLVLSLTVEPAVLGNYAVAASLTALAVPVAAGLGYVAFPRIAAHRELRSATAGLQRAAVAASAGIATILMLPLMACAPWLVPALFGEGFQDAVVLVLLLAPGGVARTCQQVCADLLRGHGRPFAVARAQGAAAATMVALLAVLVPIAGAAGAAIAATVSSAMAFLLLLRALNRALSHTNGGRPDRDRVHRRVPDALLHPGVQPAARRAR